MKKLTVEEVYKKSLLSTLDFKTTADIEPLEEDIIRQNRAKDAIKFGLSIDKYGYNIFVSGSSSTKKRTYLEHIINEFAKKKPIPNDLCFVNNFKDETKPILISLPNGKGKTFKKDMDNFITILKEDVMQLFKTDNYNKNKEFLLQEYDLVYEELYELYNKKMEEYQYILAETSDGVLPVPMKKDGNPYTQEEYNKLSEEEREVFINNKKKIDIIMIELTYKETEIEKQKEEDLHKLEVNLIKDEIKEPLHRIKRKYQKTNKQIVDYLNELENDIIENIKDFKPKEEKPQGQVIQIVNSSQEEDEDAFNKYSVNLFVDNKELKNAPVIFVDELELGKLFGVIEYNVKNNILASDFTNVRSGYFTKANGGYLVINIQDLFKYHHLWDKFKTIIKTRELTISARQYKDIVITNALDPNPIDLDVKVVLIGDLYWYYLLLENDPEFKELFRVHAVFDDDVERTEEVEKEYLQFVSKYVRTNKLRPFNKEALLTILEYSARVADQQDKLILNYYPIYKILDEADALANILNKDIVDKESVEKALEQQKYLSNSYNERFNEYIKDDTFMINTEGLKVGEINGLSVLDYGDFSIGRPTRITVNTYRGSDGIISVDRNVKLSGKIHNKGVEIIKGFLGKELAQKYPLSLTANISFEQNYGGIDGDSATSTELYAILSDLSGVPIKQNIAVTGSMNQKGEVQAIGGVNEKIEGFYSVCKNKGLTGEQGVIIPYSNVKNLMLSKEVRESIEKEEFHIYAVKHIREGIEILTDKSFDYIKQIIEEKIEEIKDIKTK